MERGKSREEIAELIGVTVGSLQVTCSRLGISLRRRDAEDALVLAGLLSQTATDSRDAVARAVERLLELLPVEAR